jgi:hypothetical protein
MTPVEVGGRPRRGADTDHSAAAAMARPGPMAAGADRVAANPHTPLMERAGETPYPSRAQPDQIYRDRNSLPAEPAGYSLPGKRPLPSQTTGTWQKFCDRGRLSAA